MGSNTFILDETQYVVENAQQVMIDRDKILALPIHDKKVPSWECDVHYSPKGNEQKNALWYVLLLDTLNFCFWNTPEKKWCTSYKATCYSGYKALAASLSRAIEENIPITNAYYLRSMPAEDLAHILRGEGELLLMQERLDAVHELGSVLIEKHHGDAFHLIEEAGFDALSFACLMAKQFSSFRDVANYKGKTIPLLKRAQILAADINGIMPHTLMRADRLTAFADYKLPQLLQAYGVLQYETSLEKKIKNGIELPAGSEEEIEIRASTIHAVELIRQETNFAAYQVDWILWTTAKELPLPRHHYTRTIFY